MIPFQMILYIHSAHDSMILDSLSALRFWFHRFRDFCIYVISGNKFTKSVSKCFFCFSRLTVSSNKSPFDNGWLIIYRWTQLFHIVIFGNQMTGVNNKITEIIKIGKNCQKFQKFRKFGFEISKLTMKGVQKSFQTFHENNFNRKSKFGISFRRKNDDFLKRFNNHTVRRDGFVDCFNLSVSIKIRKEMEQVFLLLGNPGKLIYIVFSKFKFLGYQLDRFTGKTHPYSIQSSQSKLYQCIKNGLLLAKQNEKH